MIHYPRGIDVRAERVVNHNYLYPFDQLTSIHLEIFDINHYRRNQTFKSPAWNFLLRWRLAQAAIFDVINSGIRRAMEFTLK